MKKIYLAGPDVFRENPFEFFEKQKQLCIKYGFIGLSPFDNEDGFDGELFSKLHSTHVFKGNVGIVREKCDIIVANLVPFRGACVDDGTAWELGCGYANGKLLYGYTPYHNVWLPNQIYNGDYPDSFAEFPNVESFKFNSVNHMIQESIELSGGRILSTFEDCLIDLKKKFYD